MAKFFEHNQLAEADLVIDAIYRAGTATNLKAEVLSKLLPVGNAGGFRIKGRGDSVKLVVLTSNTNVSVWPDSLNVETGQVCYFGDNREPGDLHSTKGNRLLRDYFAKIHTSTDSRREVPVFLYFEKFGSGRDWCFKGLLVPGGPGVSRDDELVAIWRTSDTGERFQNYQASFTVLDAPIISRAWINQILEGNNCAGAAPPSYTDWVKSGRIRPLVAPRAKRFRTREEQIPEKKEDQLLLKHLVSQFESEPHGFEFVALEIWKLVSKEPVTGEITRKSADGGRDANGHVYIGPQNDLLPLEFILEAKCYSINNSVGVKETSRLVSRIRENQFGVLITTSFVAKQAYEEVREGIRPVVILSGADVISVLKANGIYSKKLLDQWLTEISANNSKVSY